MLVWKMFPLHGASFSDRRISADAGSSCLQLSILILFCNTRFLSLETFGQKTRVGNGSDISKFLLREVSATEPVLLLESGWKGWFVIGGYFGWKPEFLSKDFLG